MKVFEAKYIRGSLEDTFGSVSTNNGTTTFAQTKKGYAIRLNGSSKWISYAGSRSVKSVVIWLYANTLSKDIIDFDGGTHSIEVGAANITATGFASPSIYVDAISSPVLDIARWRCVVITTATGFTANALKIGKETSFFNGDIAMVKLYDNTLSQVDIDKEQAEFERAKIISRANSGFVLSKPNDLSREVRNTLGNELISNPGPFFNTTGWFGFTANLSVINSKLKVITTAQYGRAYTSFSTIIGNSYTITVNINIISGIPTLEKTDDPTSNVNAVYGVRFINFTATATTTYIWVIGNSVNNEYEIISISAKMKVGLIFASNMVPRGTTLTDISGNGNNGVVSNCVQTKDSLLLSGVNSKVTGGNIGNVRSIAFRIKPYATTCKILEGRANAALVHINAGTLTASDFATLYVNGVAVSSIPVAGQWVNVVLTSASDVAFSSWTLGLNNTTYGKFEISDIRIWNRQISATEAKSYSNSFIIPTFNEDFSTYSIQTL